MIVQLKKNQANFLSGTRIFESHHRMAFKNVVTRLASTNYAANVFVKNFTLMLSFPDKVDDKITDICWLCKKSSWIILLEISALVKQIELSNWIFLTEKSGSKNGSKNGLRHSILFYLEVVFWLLGIPLVIDVVGK